MPRAAFTREGLAIIAALAQMGERMLAAGTANRRQTSSIATLISHARPLRCYRSSSGSSTTICALSRLSRGGAGERMAAKPGSERSAVAACPASLSARSWQSGRPKRRRC